MTNLLVMKEQLKTFYGKYDVFITPVLKFLLALISLVMLNQNIGYMYRLKNPAIVLIISLLCSFMPVNLIVVFCALYIVLHVYALSMECAIVVFVLILLMFLLYFRFSPKDALAVVFTPICFHLNIPYVIPLTMGFVGTPLSAVSVACGVVVYYVLNYISINSQTLGNLEAESMIQKFQYVVDNLLNNRSMIVMTIAFSMTIIIVYLIRRLSIDHSWRIALGVGSVLDLIIILMGDMFMDLNVSLVGIILGTIVSVLLIIILQFFVFSVDYSRTEFVQFEDDEYYYYVKAVPKMTVAVPEKKVKRINPQKKSSGKGSSGKSVSRRNLNDDFDIR